MDSDMHFNEETGMNERECNICELPHAIGTPHPERIHPGRRTQRVRAAAVRYSNGFTVIVANYGGCQDVSSMKIATGSDHHGDILGRCFVEFDIPLDEVPVIEGHVEEAKREGGEKL